MNREWQRDVDRDIRDLKQRTAHLPSRIRPGAGGTTTTETGFIPYLAESAAELPNTDIEAYALGFITAGDEIGAWYERNRDNDGWQGRTIWHT